MPANDAPQSSLILYQTEDGRTRIQCRFEDETIWLTQALIAELFQITVPTVNEHLKGIFTEGELAPEATIRKFRIVRREGSREVAREIEHYSHGRSSPGPRPSWSPTSARRLRIRFVRYDWRGRWIVVPILESKIESIAQMCARYGVAHLYVFGSALRDDFRPGESDVDLLVEFRPMDPFALADAYFGLLDALRSLVGGDIDLVMTEALKNRYIAADIERSKQVLYAA